VGEDAALQRAADVKAEHEKTKDTLASTQKMLRDSETDHSKTFAQLQQAQKDHVESVAKLKADVLVPALRDLHARQQADIAAKQKAELDALQSR
jgi:hypothetical protein